MQIIKRDGSYQDYSSDKIANAIRKAFIAQEKNISDNELKDIIFSIENEIDFRLDRNEPITVEWIQDRVEIELMKREHFNEVRSYILYREEHTKTRQAINGIVELLGNKDIIPVLRRIQKDYQEDVYDLNILLQKYKLLARDGMSEDLALDILVESAMGLVSKEAPKYEYIAGRLFMHKLNKGIDNKLKSLGISSFYDKVLYLALENLYGDFLIDNYTEEEIKELGEYIDETRDELLSYASLRLISEQYLVDSNEYGILEKPQEMFMSIAMHLAMNESEKMYWAKNYYDGLSKLKFTLNSKIMTNARRHSHQMSSSFVDTVPNDLLGIYKTVENYSLASKSGGGVGLYFGKVKASNNNENGAARFGKLIFDAVKVVDNDSNKKNICTAYIDVWHKDVIDFLSLNDGKQNGIMFGLCYPDLFWKMARDNINDAWYMMCPQEIFKVKGYCLEDYYGQEFEKRYFDCIKDDRISKTSLAIKEIIRIIIKSLIETGMPFTFNRDIVNIMNPNKHCGIIYCSDLSTKICQNTSAINFIDQDIVINNDLNQNVVIEKYEAGDYATCNMGSINLGAIDIKDNRELKSVIDIAVRALDEIIELNDYEIPYAKITNRRYRSIGLGVIGYQHCLVKNKIDVESDEHLMFANDLFERINFFAINASATLAKQKGTYDAYPGSDWQTGEYFSLRNYIDDKWTKLASKVKQHGMRNGNLLAVSPTSLSSLIASTTCGIEPIFDKYVFEERNSFNVNTIVPDLDANTFWLYKNAYSIGQDWLLKANSVRSRHIDQSQAMCLYITSNYTYRQVLALLIHASELKIKTIYFIKNKSI